MIYEMAFSLLYHSEGEWSATLCHRQILALTEQRAPAHSRNIDPIHYAVSHMRMNSGKARRRMHSSRPTIGSGLSHSLHWNKTEGGRLCDFMRRSNFDTTSAYAKCETTV